MDDSQLYGSFHANRQIDDFLFRCQHEIQKYSCSIDQPQEDDPCRQKTKQYHTTNTEIQPTAVI